MSKLKRKKYAEDDSKSAPNLKKFTSRDPESLRSSDGTSSSDRNSSISGPWWTSTDLTEVEKLWKITLQASCPVFSSPDVASCIPELPQIPAKPEKKSEQCWCSLDEDVSELPVLNDPAVCVSACTAPHLTSNQRNHKSDLFSDEQQTKTKSQQQPVAKDNQDKCPRDTASLRDWTDGWKSENQRTSRFGESRLESDTKTKVVSSNIGPKPGMKNSTTAAESRTELGVKSVSRTSGLESDDECRPGTSRGGSGCGLGLPESKLECCPMCMMPFPAEFSQMDCDGHLAQCLSEMDTDVLW